MKKLSYLIFVGAMIFLLSCADEPVNKAKKEQALIGFWEYKRVLINGTDLKELTSGFEVSNFLHLKDDKSYTKAYILGEWEVTGKTLSLQEFTSSLYKPREYTIISLTRQSLILQTTMKKSEYNIGIDQFEEYEILTITEEFERIEQH